MTTLDYRSTQPAPSTIWIVACACAWILGVQFFLLTDRWLVRSTGALAVYAVAIAICFFPPIRRLLFLIGSVLEKRGTFWTSLLFLVISLSSIVFLYSTALFAKRQFAPVIHDEFSYQLQATMLAHGKLAMPEHPLAPFFDTFYVLTQGVYASQYFPGAALMFVPGVWLGLADWVMPLLVSGAVAGLLFLVMRELFDGLCALSAVIVLCGVQWFRFLSITTMAQHPALLLGLLAIYATLKFCQSPHWRWIAVGSAALAWMAITRPVDAIVYAVPLVVLALIEQRKLFRVQWRRWVVAAVLPALPFLMLQVATNLRVTGSLFESPFALYAQRDLPGTGFGFHSTDEAQRPASPLPQKQSFYADNVRPLIQSHTPLQVVENWYSKRLRTLAKEVFADMLLLILVPAALIAMRDRRQWIVVSILPLWCISFSFYVFDYAHYYVTLLPSVLVLVFAGFDSIERLFPGGIQVVRSVRAVLPAAIAVAAMPQFKIDLDEQFLKLPMEAAIREFEKTIDGPGILLVRWGPENAPHAEVVYNVHNVWPDNAKLIRAHDLGEAANQKLFRYYAQRQPARKVYLFDRDARTFTELGFVSELPKTSATPGDSIRASGPATSRPATTRSEEKESIVHE